MYDFCSVIIGAGVVGLAIARDLSQRGQAVLVVDKEKSFGMGISSRNSEVIHAGIYYKSGSLKAKHCVLGRALLYDYCEKKSINYRRIGKLIVATEQSELGRLHEMQARSVENGLIKSDRLEYLSKTKVQKIAPELFYLAALHSPETGILDSHSYMQNLVWDAQSCGAIFAYETSVKSIEYKKGLTISGESVGEYFEVKAKNVIMAAGIHTAKLSTDFGLPTPHSYWLKGNYFRLKQKSPFDQLVYPVPSSGGLGVHLTIDLGGRAKFGPDVQPVENEDYAVDPLRIDDFEHSIRKYWPGLPSNSIYPDYAGIRPKLYSGPEGEPDFTIYTPEKTGLEGLYVLHGIESPGLTSSLSLASEISNKIQEAN